MTGSDPRLLFPLGVPRSPGPLTNPVLHLATITLLEPHPLDSEIPMGDLQLPGLLTRCGDSAVAVGGGQALGCSLAPFLGSATHPHRLPS